MLEDFYADMVHDWGYGDDDDQNARDLAPDSRGLPRDLNSNNDLTGRPLIGRPNLTIGGPLPCLHMVHNNIPLISRENRSARLVSNSGASMDLSCMVSTDLSGCPHHGENCTGHQIYDRARSSLSSTLRLTRTIPGKASIRKPLNSVDTKQFLLGKKGIRSCLKGAIRGTFRGVATPSRVTDEVGIPMSWWYKAKGVSIVDNGITSRPVEVAYKNINPKNIMAIVTREPILGTRSLIVTKVALHGGDSITMHPSCMSMLSGDYDGDEISVMIILSSAAVEECRQYMAIQQNKITRKVVNEDDMKQIMVTKDECLLRSQDGLIHPIKSMRKHKIRTSDEDIELSNTKLSNGITKNKLTRVIGKITRRIVESLGSFEVINDGYGMKLSTSRGVTTVDNLHRLDHQRSELADTLTNYLRNIMQASLSVKTRVKAESKIELNPIAELTGSEEVEMTIALPCRCSEDECLCSEYQLWNIELLLEGITSANCNNLVSYNLKVLNHQYMNALKMLRGLSEEKIDPQALESEKKGLFRKCKAGVALLARACDMTMTAEKYSALVSAYYLMVIQGFTAFGSDDFVQSLMWTKRILCNHYESPHVADVEADQGPIGAFDIINRNGSTIELSFTSTKVVCYGTSGSVKDKRTSG